MKKTLSTLLLTALLAVSVFAGGTQEEPAAELRFIDSFDREIVLDAYPAKVVSLAPGITETIFTLGQGDLLVGRTDYCDFPADVSDVASIGSMTEPSIEAIVALEPELVIASTHVQKETAAQLEELGIPVAVFYGAESMEGAYGVIQSVGDILNASEAAESHINTMKATVSEIQTALEGVEPKTVYYVVGFGEWGDFTAGGDTFIHQLLTYAGGINIASDIEGWNYSLEKIVEHDPEIVICSQYWGAKEGLLAANGYKDLTALQKDQLFTIDNNMIDRQGPRLAEGLMALAKILHPEQF